jgi:flagellar assembly protein FliH
MSLPSEAQRGAAVDARGFLPAVAANAEAMTAFIAPEKTVAPFEFRSLADDDIEYIGAAIEPRNRRQGGDRRTSPRMGEATLWDGGEEISGALAAGRRDRRPMSAAVREAVEVSRREGLQEGEREGRRLARAEMEAESLAALTRERERIVVAVREFGAARGQYFAGVEQQVVKLALAIAARVLHREAQVDPLLLAGAVRVALEKLADRSGVVLRVAATDVDGWERIFLATEPSERPQVVPDARLALGECVLETKMGTVELGVCVQLEEIEKGFFDLLNHRPVQ